MKKTYKIIITSAAVAGTLAAIAPFAAYAQEMQKPPMLRPAAVRAANLDHNRDIRNETMKQRATSSPVRIEMRAEMRDVREARLELSKEDRRPMWLTGTSSAARKLNPAIVKMLQERMKEASTTLPEGHGNWQKARLDIFATMQSNLISKSQKALDSLKELRNKIADRIQTATQNGRDMTEAKQLLVVADQKIIAADAAISSLATLTPSFVATSTTKVDASTEVELNKPREIGRTAIQALTDVRKALNDVVVSIAHHMGKGEGATATTTATTTQQ